MKKFLSSILAVLVISLSLPYVAWAEVRDNGVCGDNLTWELSDDRILTISGTGAMDNYDDYDDYDEGYDYGYNYDDEQPFLPPWYEYRNDISKVIINLGITNIGSNAFKGCSQLNTISLPCKFDVGLFGSNDIYSYGDSSGITPIEVNDDIYQKFNVVDGYLNGTFEYVHNWSNWTTETAATCTTAGTQQRVCTSCNKIETKTIPELGHNHDGNDFSATETKLGGTKYVCSRGDDSYWVFTRGGFPVQTLMPSDLGTIHDYCDDHNLSAHTTVSLGNGKTVKVCLHDPLGALKEQASDKLGLNVTHYEKGTPEYENLMNQYDGQYDIEHINFFEVYPTVNDNKFSGDIPEGVYMEYEIPEDYDESDLEMIRIVAGSDQEFDEKIVDIDGKKYLALWKNHFSPYAMIDKLTSAEKAGDSNNIKTGDESSYIVMAFMTAAIIAGLYISFCLKKKFEEVQ